MKNYEKLLGDCLTYLENDRTWEIGYVGDEYDGDGLLAECYGGRGDVIKLSHIRWKKSLQVEIEVPSYFSSSFDHFPRKETVVYSSFMTLWEFVRILDEFYRGYYDNEECDDEEHDDEECDDDDDDEYNDDEYNDDDNDDDMKNDDDWGWYHEMLDL